MSFGKYQYQHRFYNNQPHKKIVGEYTNNNSVLPISNYVATTPYYTPQISKPPVYSKPLNLRVRAGQIAYNQPGWEGYRLKSYVTDKYSQNYLSYQSDREIIQKFKREADQEKRRKRFESQYSVNPYRIIQRPQQMRQKTEYDYNQRKEFFPSINPQKQQSHNRYDVGVMARLQTQPPQPFHLPNTLHRDQAATRQSRQQETRSRQRRQQQKRRQQDYKLRQYKKKYKKMKDKLKEELCLQKKFQKQSQYRNNDPQQNEFEKIGHLISDVSQQIVKNTVIFNEGLRVQKQLRQMRQNALSVKQQTKQSKQALPQSRISIRSKNEQQQEHLSSPKVVYTSKPLNKSYMELKQLRSQMDYINKKMGRKDIK